MARNDLSQFESTPVPRPEGFCRPHVRRISPIWGFLVYGVLWLLLSEAAFAAGMTPGILLGAAVGAKTAWWVRILEFAGGLAMFALTWIGYARWVRRRRQASRRLVRDGLVIEGRVFDPRSGGLAQAAGRFVVNYAVSQFGVKFYRVDVVVDGVQRVLRVPRTSGAPTNAGAVVPVLYCADSKLALVFGASGRAFTARVF